MAILISGPGVGLPYPQNLYPTELNNAPPDISTNTFTLNGGDALPIPAGRWWVNLGGLCVLQFLDPITETWRIFDSARGQSVQIVSDGFTRRVANLTGCPVAAVVANGGSGFTQSTATISASTGGSSWAAIVGGSLSVSTINYVGANYTMPPIVLIPAPPAVPGPGIPATAYATIASGTVSAVSLTNFGAGYAAASLTVICLPNPTDPNIGTISNATVTLVLNAANSAAITGAICTNNGAPLATLSSLTLTAAGGSGTGATITPVIMQTVTGATVGTAGTGWTGGAALTTVGGRPVSVSAIVNPSFELTSYTPRAASALIAASAGALSSLSTIYDNGLFTGTPTAVVTPLTGVLPTATASVSLTMGYTNSTVVLQPV